MKRQHALLSSMVLGIMAISPALADGWYEHHDHDHDGRWNYNEFRAANNNWYAHHAGEHRYNDRELRNQFNHYDADHDGFVTREQVQTFHTW